VGDIDFSKTKEEGERREKAREKRKKRKKKKGPEHINKSKLPREKGGN